MRHFNNRAFADLITTSNCISVFWNPSFCINLKQCAHTADPPVWLFGIFSSIRVVG